MTTIPTRAADIAAAQAQLDQAERDLKDARAAFDTAAVGYQRAQHSPPGEDYQRARAAWAMTGQEWMSALIRRADATYRLTCERNGWSVP